MPRVESGKGEGGVTEFSTEIPGSEIASWMWAEAGVRRGSSKPEVPQGGGAHDGSGETGSDPGDGVDIHPLPY